MKDAPLCRCVKPRLDRQAAERKLRSRSLNPFRLLVPFASPIALGSTSALANRLPYLELVRMPYYHVGLELPGPGASTEIACLVEAYSGAITRFDSVPEAFEAPADQPRFNPRFSAAEAEALARGWAARALSGRKGAREIGKTLFADLIDYPFWVYYYERRRGKIDVRLLDAVSGVRPGARLKASLLQAFAEAAAAAGD